MTGIKKRVNITDLMILLAACVHSRFKTSNHIATWCLVPATLNSKFAPPYKHISLASPPQHIYWYSSTPDTFLGHLPTTLPSHHLRYFSLLFVPLPRKLLMANEFISHTSYMCSEFLLDVSVVSWQDTCITATRNAKLQPRLAFVTKGTAELIV